MKLEQALREYEKKAEKMKKERAKIEEKYNRKLVRDKQEILKRIDDLEGKQIPKDVDDRIKKIVGAERRMYVSTLKRMLEKVETMEDFGKLLPELSKLHVSHGKYLLVLFEKDVYGINRILKRMSEEYQEYLEKLSKTLIPEIKIDVIEREKEEIAREIEQLSKEKESIESAIEQRKEDLRKFYDEADLEGIEEKIKELEGELKKEELELRSKISKLQKPIKRMRTGEEVARRTVENSYYAVEHPDEFISFLIKTRSRLEGKYKKTADWLLENLKDRAEKIRKMKGELSELIAEKEEILSDGRDFEEDIKRLERNLREKEEQISKLRERLKALDREYRESIRELEKLLGKKIEIDF
ncbi:hypothetical protein [Thermococcus sp.]